MSKFPSGSWWLHQIVEVGIIVVFLQLAQHWGVVSFWQRLALWGVALVYQAAKELNK